MDTGGCYRDSDGYWQGVGTADKRTIEATMTVPSAGQKHRALPQAVAKSPAVPWQSRGHSCT